MIKLILVSSIVLSAQILFAAVDLGEVIKKVEQVIIQETSAVQLDLANMNPNRQNGNFEEMVFELDQLIKSDQVLELVSKSHTLQQYRNLMENHLLHIQLSNKIEAFESLKYMYPHEMPFEHSGALPSLPTFQTLEKVSEFLNLLKVEVRPQAYSFVDARMLSARQTIMMAEKATGSGGVYFKNAMESGFDFRANKSYSENLEILAKKLSKFPNNKILIRKLIEIQDLYFYKKERDLIDKISSAPHKIYDDFKARVEKDGLNTSFKSEFASMVYKIQLAAKTLSSVEKALLVEPKLRIMHENLLLRLQNLVSEDRFGYREVLDEIARATEFFDLVERSQGTSKSNPLHYAKRYEYYLHTVLGWAPKHFTIPSSAHLRTYDLLTISSAPIGFAGVATESLWVDSYLQSPNEFLLHDAANHERRRFQFTRNYFFRLGIEEKDFAPLYHNIDDFLQKEFLPMIKKIDRFKSKDIRFDNREIFLKDFISLLPGPEYFTQELDELKDELRTSEDYRNLNNKYRVKINRKKTLYDMILFEVVHEDALPPAKWAIFESLLRSPNLPMPRDFIDIGSKTAHHTMEPAGTTMAYILEKLNGSFYDTPKERILAVSSEEYRTPKAIIKATSDIVKNFGGFPGMSDAQVLEQLVYLTVSEEGFLTYLTEEFQRDLHPRQRALLRSLKYAEALEVLSLVGQFNVDHSFTEFMKDLRERINLSKNLELNSSNIELDRVDKELAKLDNRYSHDFEEAREFYFKLASELNEKLYYEKKKELDLRENLKERSLESIELEIARLQEKGDFIREALQSNKSSKLFEDLERLVFNVDSLKELAIKKRRSNVAKDFVTYNQEMWRSVPSSLIDTERLVNELAVEFHDKAWRPNFRLNHGVKAHFRNVPKSLFLKSESHWDARLRFENMGFIGLRVNPDGVFQQNINLPSNKIIPELFDQLNTRVAKKYVDLVLKAKDSGKVLTQDLIHELSNEVHKIWMENNLSKTETSLVKMGISTKFLTVTRVLDVVEKLELKDWEKLNTDEVKGLNQYRDSKRLSEREISNDKSMIMSVVGNMLEGSYYEKSATNRVVGWQSLGGIELNVVTLAEKLSKHLHQVWLDDYRLLNSNTPRYRSIPIHMFATKDVDAIVTSLKDSSYQGIEYIESKAWSQNINQNYSNLIPELRYLLTGALASEYVKLIQRYRSRYSELSPDLLSEISFEVHQVWMEHNKWQLDSILKKLGLNHQEMSVSEIIDTFRNLEKSKWLQMKPNEVEKIYQFSLTKDLSWSTHKRNIDMVLKSVDFLSEYSTGKCKVSL